MLSYVLITNQIKYRSKATCRVYAADKDIAAVNSIRNRFCHFGIFKQTENRSP